MHRYIRFKAGKAVIDTIRQQGLNPGKVAVFAAPAGGPKWFVCPGFDRTLIRTGFLNSRQEKVQLVGSSAGGWRCLAMACRDPLDAYEKLRIAYSRNIFTKDHNQLTISQALRGNVDAFITDADIPYILDHKTCRVAIHVVRAKGPAACENRAIQGAALLSAFVLNAASAKAMRALFERVVFFSGSDPPLFTVPPFDGTAIPLDGSNLREAALATGSLPYIVAGVKDVPGAPQGVYRDGGLLDYQLNLDYRPGPECLTLFFHYQERIVPGWLDKVFNGRKPPAGSLDRVLQVFPGEDFLKLLPEGRLPDREDFVTFADRPAERIRRWDEVSRLSDVLGEEFMEAVESSRIRHLVEPL
ncbi:MAG: hypothetical protein AB1646_08415 [Thermodesulfobacteriota bacterium]